MNVLNNYSKSCSIFCLNDWISPFNCDDSLDKIEHDITGRDTPHARPKAILDGTNT